MNNTQFYGKPNEGPIKGHLRTTSEINAHLIEKDPVFEKIIGMCGSIEMELSKDHFSSLVEMIINQQLSNKAAFTICERFSTLCKGDVCPDSVLSLTEEEMRSAGLSRPKIKYIMGLATSVKEQSIPFDDMEDMNDEDAIIMLSSQKGIGRWTAEMFLIFVLGREDVFAMGDVGLQRAVEHMHGVDDLDALKTLSETWAPYRTYASLYLWDILDKGMIRSISGQK